jgi:PHD/YefM family antitoxin component YafN of YafNO toxin-antitoxin module
MPSTGDIPVSELRDRLAAVIAELPKHGKAIKLTRHGQPVAVLLGYGAFEALLDDLDDADDYRSLAEYDADDEHETLPWELAKKDLGIIA